MTLSAWALGLVALVSLSSPPPTVNWQRQVVDGAPITIELPAPVAKQESPGVEGGAPLVETMSLFSCEPIDSSFTATIVVSRSSEGFEVDRAVLELAAEGIADGIREEVEGLKVVIGERENGVCGEKPAVRFRATLGEGDDRYALDVVVIGDTGRWVTLLVGHGPTDKHAVAFAERAVRSIEYDGKAFEPKK
jgi:hypothetical protein